MLSVQIEIPSLSIGTVDKFLCFICVENSLSNTLMPDDARQKETAGTFYF